MEITSLGFFRKYDNEIRYENPMLPLRRKQLGWLDQGITNEAILREIFESIPKNFRAMYMYEREFEKARNVCAGKFVECMKICLGQCIQDIA